MCIYKECTLIGSKRIARMGGKLSSSSKLGSGCYNLRAGGEYAVSPSREVIGFTSCFVGKKLRKKKKKKKKKKQKNDKKNKKDQDGVSCEPEPSEKKAKLTRHHLTLEEWIWSSPGTDMARKAVAGDELLMFCQAYKRKTLSPSVCSNVIATEEGFPSRRVVPEDAEEDSVSICRSESRPSRKKVSFRLPEETNSIVFYTPSPVETDPNSEIVAKLTSRIVIRNSQ
ncbi:hypothetical protein MLD38_040594 [Melastoma candidum]|nr:hypothetical protein MLD38_040594 [Melastoma candidum]